MEYNYQSPLQKAEALYTTDIPASSEALKGSHVNLEGLAKYCQESLALVPDRAAALDKTKQFARDALSSVAYQVRSHAASLTEFIEEQTFYLAELESQIATLSLRIKSHSDRKGHHDLHNFLADKSSRTVERKEKFVVMEEDPVPEYN
eukprot:Colp12_sorted_trinity150504_noHs@8584